MKEDLEFRDVEGYRKLPFGNNSVFYYPRLHLDEEKLLPIIGLNLPKNDKNLLVVPNAFHGQAYRIAMFNYKEPSPEVLFNGWCELKLNKNPNNSKKPKSLTLLINSCGTDNKHRLEWDNFQDLKTHLPEIIECKYGFPEEYSPNPYQYHPTSPITDFGYWKHFLESPIEHQALLALYYLGNLSQIMEKTLHQR